MPSESLHRTSSVRTSSSHRSTIEPRGAPEFDREYARQLSLAKRGRNSSVKTSQCTTPMQEFQPEGPLHGAAALAASRIKDYVATHVTPPRIPHLSSVSPICEHGGKGLGASKVATTHRNLSQALATPNSGETETGPETPFSKSTRRGSALEDTEAPTAATTDGEGNLLLFLVSTILFVGIAFFTLFCAISFVVSVSTDYNPSYFSFNAPSLPPRSGMRDSIVGRRRWPDRLVPEFHRQVALRIRRALWHVLSYVGVSGVFRFVGSVLSTWKSYVGDPLHAMLPRIDTEVHPMLRFFFLNATESGEEWGFNTVLTLAASVARSLVQLVVDPVLIVGRTVQALHRWRGGPMALFSTSLKPLQATPVNMSSMMASAQMNGTSVTTRTASSSLLWFWRPLHLLWEMAMAAYPSLGDAADLHNHTGSAARVMNVSTTPDSSLLSPQIEKTPSRTSAEVTPCFVAPHVESRRTYTRRLEGALWPSLLDEHRREIEGLARDDVCELLQGDSDATQRVDVALNSDPLVIEVTVTSQVAVESTPCAAGGGMESTAEGPGSAHHAQKIAIDAERQQWPFPRLRAFYNRAASAAEAARTSGETFSAAVAACEGQVKECQQQCASIRGRLERELRNCTQGARQSNPWLANAGEEATKELSAQIRECSDELANCRARFLRPTAVLADGFGNSEAERQRCSESLVTAAQECEQRLRDTRSSLDADHAKQLSSLSEECAIQRSALEKASLEKVELAVKRAEAMCSEQLKASASACNESVPGALESLQETLNAAKTEAEKRLATCTVAAEQARVSFSAERAQWDAFCATKLQNAQVECETTERHAAEERCAEKLAKLDEETRRASTTAALKAETECEERLSRELSALNNNLTMTASKLQLELQEMKREGLRSAPACDTSQQQAEAECQMRLKRVREDCTAQLLKTHEDSAVATQQALEEERKSQRGIYANNWRLEEERLAAQCAATTQAAVNEASHLLAAKHAKAQEEAAVEEQRRMATQLRQKEEACRIQSEELRKHHQGQVRDLGAQITACTERIQVAEAVHQDMQQKARQVFYAAIADSARDACLEVTQHNLPVCTDVRKTVEEELHKLPSNASPTDAFTQLLKSATEPGRLTWKFSGASVQAPRVEEIAATGGRLACFTSYLRVPGLLFTLFASACILATYPRARRLPDDKIARLDMLIAANETATMRRSPKSLSRSKTSRSGYPGQLLTDIEAPLSWDVLEVCMTNSLETLLEWHSTSCALLLEQETHNMGGKLHQVNMSRESPATDSLTSLSENVLGDAHAPSISRDGPAGSLSSASTLPIAREDAERLSQLHAAFINGYYSMLEMYYVDFLSAVANRELTGRQLQYVESMVAQKTEALQKQSALVEQLRLSLAEKEKPASPSTMNQLAKVEGHAEVQEETVSLLENQLKISRDEVDKASGVVSRPPPSPHTTLEAATVTAPESWKSPPMRSLQELTDGSAHIDSMSALAVSAEGNPSLRLTVKKPTMMRNPDVTRRYQKLRWNEDVDMT
ncbi:hypothetical protein, unknown function [Leishmania tarentolae]|uniref:Uncharacterized protein n=1 Tax=Leishmania tarentolae TaxID=5689 RepID=A0A640KP35_LEITA|nr:hypothetical protein, unknown function [Leishmania tarentolae]